MPEKSIPFTAPMALAAWEGRKTQTRRPVKQSPIASGPNWNIWWSDKLQAQVNDKGFATTARYRPGDILLVGEPWRAPLDFDKLKPSELPDDCPVAYEADLPYRDSRALTAWGRYRNARFLPFRFRRTRLEVLDVRVERVQEISEEDAAKEGIRYEDGSYELEWMTPNARGKRRIEDFRKLWDSIHGLGAWDRNDWVWRIEFRKVTA